ncbi:ribbon-helix-helix protein, CopG family [Thiohalophilus sp.]|uniref:ribbon-helix-helix protein, CopG family n=1 Tax=Thiohalophilus sp. TaxID=3028392 RepID=UPI003976C2F7
MPKIKISARVDAAAWKALQKLAKESHKSLSQLLTEAIEDSVRKHRVRPITLEHLSGSIKENEELGKLLAR